MVYDCIVVGGGAAGMMAAITAKRTSQYNSGYKIAIIEHTERLGTKILSTGNGKCNLTHRTIAKENYLSDNKSFVMSVIDSFSVEDTLEFFKSIGVPVKDKNGYIYPNSETAASVQNALVNEVKRLEIPVFYKTEISRISKCTENYRLTTNNGTYDANKLIIACGSMAHPKTGSDGSGYELLKRLGVKISKPLPALTSLITSEKNSKLWSGVRSTGKVTLFINGEKKAEETGELQLTDYGVSGIPVFQISRYAVYALNSVVGDDTKERRSVNLCIDFLPDYSNAELLEYFNGIKNLTNIGNRSIEDSLDGVINKKIISAICKMLNWGPKSAFVDLDDKKLNKLIDVLKTYRTEITGYKDYEFAQVCQGGIRLSELDDNLQLKELPGIYVAGEICDVDGMCGGFNLQWAWSSGAVAGKSTKVLD